MLRYRLWQMAGAPVGIGWKSATGKHYAALRCNNSGLSPDCYFCATDAIPAPVQLLAAGADTSASTHSGMIALMAASGMGRLLIVE